MCAEQCGVRNNLRTVDCVSLSKLGHLVIPNPSTHFVVCFHQDMYTASCGNWPHIGSSVLKKATGRGEKADRRATDVDGSESEGAPLMAGCLLALLEIEEAIMVKTIPDTARRAQVGLNHGDAYVLVSLCWNV